MKKTKTPEQDLHDKVYNFPTKHKEGFTDKDLDKLLLNYPSIKKEDVSKAIGVVTGMFKDGESVIYHTDIYYALREVLFNKKPNIFEFD